MFKFGSQSFIHQGIVSVRNFIDSEIERLKKSQSFIHQGIVSVDGSGEDSWRVRKSQSFIHQGIVSVAWQLLRLTSLLMTSQSFIHQGIVSVAKLTSYG